MKANGFGIGPLATLILAGLAVATPGVVQAGGRTLGVEGAGHGRGVSRGSVPAVLVSRDRAGVTGATVTVLVVRGLIERDAGGRLVLTMR